MITNFQLKTRRCKYHALPEEFICLNKQCQYRGLICSDCTRENHSSHFHDVRSIQTFVQTFQQKVKHFESQFQKDKSIINVKEIVRSKLYELDQALNQILFQVVKILDKEKQIIKERILKIEEKYTKIQDQYKKNLQARNDCLQYLSAYKNSPDVLKAKLLCSSEWGVVSLKNVLNEIKNLSVNKGRDAPQLTHNIIKQSEKVLKEDNFLYNLKRFASNYTHLIENTNRNTRLNSFIEKSFISTNPNNPIISNIPRSSNVLADRSKTFSLSNVNIPRPMSNQNIQSSRKPSIQRIGSKIGSDSNLQKNRHLVGLKKIRLENVIIK